MFTGKRLCSAQTHGAQLNRNNAIRISCAVSTGYGRAGSSVNIVSSSGDIDMLRNIESYYRLKINELPPNLSNII
jgi:hypothetical protein